MSPHKTWQCKLCNKRFTNPTNVARHAKDKHGRTDDLSMRVKKVQKKPTAEPSIASLMVEARLDRAMGLPVDDWLLEMLDE